MTTTTKNKQVADAFRLAKKNKERKGEKIRKVK